MISINPCFFECYHKLNRQTYLPCTPQIWKTTEYSPSNPCTKIFHCGPRTSIKASRCPCPATGLMRRDAITRICSGRDRPQSGTVSTVDPFVAQWKLENARGTEKKISQYPPVGVTTKKKNEENTYKSLISRKLTSTLHSFEIILRRVVSKGSFWFAISKP